MKGSHGDIDDWSDYSTNDPEEGLLCMQAMASSFTYRIVHNLSWLKKLPDGPSKSILAYATIGKRYIIVYVCTGIN